MNFGCLENSLYIVSYIETALSKNFQKNLIKSISKFGDSYTFKSLFDILTSVNFFKTLKKVVL